MTAGRSNYAFKNTERVCEWNQPFCIFAIMKDSDTPTTPQLDITQTLVSNSPSTFFFLVGRVTFPGSGMNEGDILVVDKAVEPYNDCKAVCFLDGEFCVKRVDTTSGGIVLRPCSEDDNRFPPVPVDPDDEITIWSVVTWVIQKA